ncbi:MAG: hypothetical protein QM800_03330 [Paludibacter sp.]
MKRVKIATIIASVLIAGALHPLQSQDSRRRNIIECPISFRFCDTCYGACLSG